MNHWCGYIPRLGTNSIISSMSMPTSRSRPCVSPSDLRLLLYFKKEKKSEAEGPSPRKEPLSLFLSRNHLHPFHIATCIAPSTFLVRSLSEGGTRRLGHSYIISKSRHEGVAFHHS